MPAVVHSATVELPFSIDLPPVSPQMHVVGRGSEGEIVCHLYINGAGLSIHGPGQAEIANVNWGKLVEIFRQYQH